MSKPNPAFLKFKREFAAACELYGGVYSEKDTIGDGAAYHVPTCWGVCRVSIHYDGWKNRRQRSYLDSIHMQFRDYTGPEGGPLCPDRNQNRGDFNRFSHKWNILYSAPTLPEARESCLVELKVRLKLLAQLTPATV